MCVGDAVELLKDGAALPGPIRTAYAGAPHVAWLCLTSHSTATHVTLAWRT